MTRPVRVLIAPNAFKGTLTAAEAAELIAAGIKESHPGAEVDLMPISDGGDGLMDVLLARWGGKKIVRRVVGPLGAPQRAALALLHGGRTAVIEMAQASGIAGLKISDLDPMRATSYGTGQLIAEAIGRGARRVLVGMGGSATNDGGAGAAQALGARLLDKRGRELPRGPAALSRLHRIERGEFLSRLKNIEVIAVSDVRNPLLGPQGSARVYGPQKGATPAMVRVLERALKRYSDLILRDLRVSVAKTPGSGAAGGLGAGLLGFLKAKIVPGADWVLDALDAGRRIRRADWLVTGEGRADRQSFFGKAPIAAIQRAQKTGVPAIFICGRIDETIKSKLKSAGVRAAVSLARPGEEPRIVMKETKIRLRAAAKHLPLGALVAGLCAFGLSARAQTAAPAASPYAEADDLYLHRNVGDNLDRSTSMLQAKLLTNPDDAEAMWRLGRNWVRAGERKTTKKDKLRFFGDAEKKIKASIAINPKNADAHFWLGLAMGRTGQTKGIMKSLFLVGPMKREMRTVLELNPKYGGAWHVLGEMDRQIPAFAGGSKKGAVQKLEKAMAIDPNYAVNYTGLAQAYLDVGEREKARATLMKFYDVKDPQDPGEYDENKRDVEEMLKHLK